MRNLIAIFFPIAILLAACYKDDDSSSLSDTQQASLVQIMAVFAPGQLGDQGYADRVLKGVNAIQNDTTIKADVQFMSSPDIESLRQQLLVWASSGTSAADGAPYSRRLLVMTELYMAKWFASLTDSLQVGDEILLLKSSENDVRKAAQIIGQQTPVYGLNISAAESIRKYAEIYMSFIHECMPERVTYNIPIYRLYSQDMGLYRDSVSETLQESLGLSALPVATSILSKEGELYSTDISGTAFEKAYATCAEQLFARAQKDPLDLFSVIDFGATNSGVNYYLMEQNSEYGIFPILLDSEPRWHLKRFCITRHFDDAIQSWVKRWCSSEPSSMPMMENHGGWDGFCTEEIDDMEIGFKISEWKENEQSGQ